jgi:cytosine/adenosine deaminase-related metal-dependent hydrolase
VALSDSTGCGLTMHVSEFEWEAERLRARRGLTPIRHLAALGFTQRVFVAAHCIFVDDDDIRAMAEGGISVAHNPVANMKSGKGAAPSRKMRDAGIDVGLGTDGPMSGNSIDVMGQLGPAVKVANLMARDNAALPPRDVVEMATIGAARAIGKAAEIGSIEPGKKADIAIVRTDAPHMMPLYDVYTALAFNATASDVATTIIDGRVVMRDGVVETADVCEARARVQSAADRLAAHVGLPPLAQSGGFALAPVRPFTS